LRLLTELRRRNVIRVAGLYLVGAWLLTQVAGTVLPMFGAPAWLPRSIVIMLALGFVPALVFAWVFELTPDGIKRDAQVDPMQSIGPQTGRRMDRMIIAVLVLALGYMAIDRLVWAPRREAAATSTATATASAAAATTAAKPASAAHGAGSIAVLPFVDMSQTKDQEYFSDGLSEQLLNALAQIPDLHVAGRTSSFYFKGRNEDLRVIGQKLNVATVLEGSVAKSGNTLRVTAQLINAADGYHLWSHTYDREFKDVFAMQDEIAAAVVDALKLKLLPGQAVPSSQRVDPAAYDQYLIGRKSGREQSIEDGNKTIQAYRKALAIDPGYAAARAGLAEALYEAAYYNKSATDVSAGQKAALLVVETAIRLEPGLADAYRVRARIRAESQYDQTGAMDDLRHALELSPNDSDILADAARLLRVSLRFEEAQVTVDKALALDPLSTNALNSKAELLDARGDWAMARGIYERTLQLAPESVPASSGLVQAWLGEGNPQAALAAIRGPEDSAGTLYTRALVEHSLGHRQASDRALADLIRNYSAGWAYQVGLIYAWRGEIDKSYQWLERATAQHDGGMLNIQSEPMLAGVRKDARYAALRKKVGFAE